MKQTNTTTIGSIVSAIVASLCCIGPVAVAILGVGSIGAFSIFEPYRPYLIGLTVLLLGVAFYLTYRKREVMCEDGTCKMESAGKWNKISVWGASVLAAFAITFPYLGIVPVVSAETDQGPAINPKSVAVLKVDGMDCKGCAAGLEATLAGMRGVQSTSVEYENAKALVHYDPEQVRVEDFTAMIDKLGFTASVVENKEEPTLNNANETLE